SPSVASRTIPRRVACCANAAVVASDRRRATNRAPGRNIRATSISGDREPMIRHRRARRKAVLRDGANLSAIYLRVRRPFAKARPAMKNTSSLYSVAALMAVLTVGTAQAQSMAGSPAAQTTLQAGFARAVAVGASDIFVGEPSSNFKPGVVHVFQRGTTSGTWTQTAELT